MRNNPMLMVWILAVMMSPVNASEVDAVSAPADARSVSAPSAPPLTAPDAPDQASETAPATPSAPEPPAATRTEIQSMIDRLAKEYGLDPDLVHALIRAESAYDPRAVSPVGAVGLMQVMPETAADYGVESVARLFEPKTNLQTGMRHLQRLLKKYDGVGPAVMAYNAGEGALERGKGFVAYPETQRYTHQVLSAYLSKKGIAPYSEDAQRVLGMALTPEMAQAGPTPRRRPTGNPQTVVAQTEIDQAIAEPVQRVRATRLKSRLATPNHSLLKSRLMGPVQRMPGQLSGLRGRRAE